MHLNNDEYSYLSQKYFVLYPWYTSM